MTTKASGQTHGRGPSFVPPRGQRISPTKLTRSTIVGAFAACLGRKGDADGKPAEATEQANPSPEPPVVTPGDHAGKPRGGAGRPLLSPVTALTRRWPRRRHPPSVRAGICSFASSHESPWPPAGSGIRRLRSAAQTQQQCRRFRTQGGEAHRRGARRSGAPMSGFLRRGQNFSRDA